MPMSMSHNEERQTEDHLVRSQNLYSFYQEIHLIYPKIIFLISCSWCFLVCCLCSVTFTIRHFFIFTAKVCVLKLDGSNELCKVDEVGELCISSRTVGDGYWGLHGKTNQVFNVRI